MRIAIFGCGYVGLVSGSCLADNGHQVTCLDNNQIRINRLGHGLVDIFEPGLTEMLARNLKSGNLAFSSRPESVLKTVDAVFIAVGTPLGDDGRADTRFVYEVAETIGRHMSHPLLVIGKSTAPVGTCDRVRSIIDCKLKARHAVIPFDVVSNPEFLKEGSAIEDFLRPDRIIVGSNSAHAVEQMKEIYAPFNRNRNRLIKMSTRSAELTKYASNAMLATKISFINEMANIAEQVGADIEDVRHGIGSDPRIGYDFIYAGCGYGGSCFPKDVAALKATAREHNYEPLIMAAVEHVNQQQKLLMADRVKSYFDGNLKGRKIAVWGLSFKPNTDDIREAPSLVAIEYLLDKGAIITAYDPAAMNNTQLLLGHHPGLHLAENKEAALSGAECLMIFTEWKTFKVLDYDMIRQTMAAPVIFDGRNLFDPQRMQEAGFVYFAVGRSSNMHQAQTQQFDGATAARNWRDHRLLNAS